VKKQVETFKTEVTTIIEEPKVADIPAVVETVTEKEQNFRVKGSVHPKMTFQSLEASLRTV